MEFIENSEVGDRTNGEYIDVIAEEGEYSLRFRKERRDTDLYEDEVYSVSSQVELDEDLLDTALSRIGMDPDVYADSEVNIIESSKGNSRSDEVFGIFAAYPNEKIMDYTDFTISRGPDNQNGAIGVTNLAEDEHEVFLIMLDFDRRLVENHFGVLLPEDFVEEAVREAEYRIDGYDFELF